MQIIIKGILIISVAAFSPSAYACESCPCDVCLSDPIHPLSAPSNLLSMNYGAAPYNTDSIRIAF